LIRNIQNQIENIYSHPSHCYTRLITCFHTTLDGDLLFDIFLTEPTGKTCRPWEVGKSQKFGKPNFLLADLERANLTRVASPPNSTIGGSCLSSLYPSIICFSSFTFPGAPYQISLPLLSWLSFHFILPSSQQQQSWHQTEKKNISTDDFCSIALYYVYGWHPINCVKYTSHRHINVCCRVFFFLHKYIINRFIMHMFNTFSCLVWYIYICMYLNIYIWHH